jgi:hypothetical protein
MPTTSTQTITRVRWSRQDRPTHVLGALLDVQRQQQRSQPWDVRSVGRRHHISLSKELMPDLTREQLTEERAMELYLPMRREMTRRAAEAKARERVEVEAPKATPQAAGRVLEPSIDFAGGERREERLFRLYATLLGRHDQREALEEARGALRYFDQHVND